MEKGTLSKIFTACGIGFMLLSFALAFFLVSLTHSNSNGNNIGTTSAMMYTFFYAIVGGLAAMIVFILIGYIIMRSVYNDAVDKVFEITGLKSAFRGITRFKGTNLTITCPEQLAVGDRVKTTGIDTYPAGRASVLVLLGTKLSPDSPEYYIADQDTTTFSFS